MSATCEQHRDEMIAFLHGELAPLEAERMRAHVERCARCARLGRRLEEGLAAARRWSPRLDPEHEEQLVQRLSPYVEARGPRRRLDPLWIGVSGVAVSVLVLLGMTAWWMGRHSEPPLARSAGLVPAAPALAGPEDPGVLRTAPAPFLRLVARADWDGAVERHGDRIDIHLTRGFVAAAMIGGPGRRLRVTTRAATVEVVGTRFFVEVGGEGATTVGVAEGKVRVSTPRHRILLQAGQTQSVDAGGESVATVGSLAAVYLQDPYLLELKSATPRRRAASPPTAAGPRPGVLAELERAERLALTGRVAAALAIYRRCGVDAEAAYDPFRDLCRFERARLIGFVSRDTERARGLLAELADSAQGEVRRQSVLALCELDLKTDPCAAMSCLDQVVRDHARDPDLRREAKRLRDRWAPAARYCGGTQDGELP